MINILLVDDQALLCEVLKTWLDVEPDIQVVGVAHNGQEAIEAIADLQPNIVLMDIDMPQMDGLRATRIISQRFPQVKVIFLSGHDDDAYLEKSLQVGAKGYLPKNTTAEELVQKIRSVNSNINLSALSQHENPLISLQAQLEEVLETHRLRFEKLIEEQTPNHTQHLERVEQKLEQRLSELENNWDRDRDRKIKELEQKNQSSWKSIRQEVANVNTQFERANRNLSNQFNRQIDNLKQDLDSKLSIALDDWSRQRAALQEWAVQRDEMRPSVEDYELKNRQEITSAIEPLQASFRETNRQLKTMRNWLAIGGLLTLFAIAVSGYVLVSQNGDRESFVPPTENPLD